MPSSFRAQSETFSQYKHHNTAKALVVVAPYGSVLFASKLYGGRVSDKAIVKDCGILDRFEEGDVILADRGFDIKQLMPAGVTVQMPAFMEGRRQLPASEERDSRRLASTRIHVERVIRRIKVFRILKHSFPLKMKPSLELIWQVCARLINFLPLLLLVMMMSPHYSLCTEVYYHQLPLLQHRTLLYRPLVPPFRDL